MRGGKWKGMKERGRKRKVEEVWTDRLGRNGMRWADTRKGKEDIV